MKKYPDLLVNLYGHTTNLGPKFNRQRVGRERSRVLKGIFEDEGIPTYRLTGNYIEKMAGTHDEYWGAEIVIDISTEESVVEIAKLELPTVTDALPGFVTGITGTITSIVSDEEPNTSTTGSIQTEINASKLSWILHQLWEIQQH